MNPPAQSDTDLQRQADEAAPNAADKPLHPGVAFYRALFDVLADPLPVDLPPGFSARVAHLARQAQPCSEGRIDRWMPRVLLASLAVLMAWTCLPALAAWLSASRHAAVDASAGYVVQLFGVLALVSLVETMKKRGRR